jgi:transcriptional regulator with XRE-family HTH domain
MEEAGDLRRNLAANIKSARKALRITQAQLAQSAGVSLPYIIDIEHCKTWVSDKTLLRLAEVFKISPYELLLPREEAPAFARTLPASHDLAYEAALEVKRQILLRLEESIAAVLAEHGTGV